MSPELLQFLLGAAPFEGVWFGDKHPTRRGAFWWRSVLRKQVEAAQLPTFVITCNDSIEQAVRGTQQQAEAKRDELKEAYFQRSRWHFGPTEEKQREAFRTRCYWAAREVTFTELSSCD